MSMWLNPNSIYSQIQLTAGLRKVKPHYLFSPVIFRYWKVTSALKMKNYKTAEKQLGLDNSSRREKKSTLIASTIKAKSGSMVMFLSASCLHLSTSLYRIKFHRQDSPMESKHLPFFNQLNCHGITRSQPNLLYPTFL